MHRRPDSKSYRCISIECFPWDPCIDPKGTCQDNKVRQGDTLSHRIYGFIMNKTTKIRAAGKTLDQRAEEVLDEFERLVSEGDHEGALRVFRAFRIDESEPVFQIESPEVSEQRLKDVFSEVDRLNALGQYDEGAKILNDASEEHEQRRQELRLIGRSFDFLRQARQARKAALAAGAEAMNGLEP